MDISEPTGVAYTPYDAQQQQYYMSLNPQQQQQYEHAAYQDYYQPTAPVPHMVWS